MKIFVHSHLIVRQSTQQQAASIAKSGIVFNVSVCLSVRLCEPKTGSGDVL